MTNLRVTKSVLLSTVAIGLALPAVAPAQEAGQVDEIIVTARKRQESILKVPVIASAITQDSLEKFQISDFRTVASRVPGFVIGDNTATGGSAQISIRGIGTTASNPTIDQAVSLNVDGLQLSLGGYAYQAAMFDVAQVEVLKGPQALFFGKNSPAGVISLRSADPTDAVEVIARTGYEFEANEKLGELILSGPVAPSLKLRLATRYSDEDGFFHNEANPTPGLGGIDPFRDSGREKNWVLRGTALFTPNDVYDARFKVNYTRQREHGVAGHVQFGYCPEGLASPVSPVQVNDLNDGCKIDRRMMVAFLDPAAFPGIPNDGVPFIRNRQAFGTLEQNVHFRDDVTLTSVTGYYEVTQDTMNNGVASSNVPTLVVVDDFQDHEFTQELRLTTDFTDIPVNFTAGGFYQKGRAKHGVELLGNTIFFPPALQIVRHEVETRSYSGFGQVRWKVIPELELAAGARYTHEERDHEQFNDLALQLPVGPVALVDPHISSNDFSPELTATYTPTDDVTLFGSYKEGFKSGSFNTVSLIPPGTPASFGPERVKGGEAGIKARLLDGRMTINLAAYRYRYEGLQVGSNENDSAGLPTIRTLNAASAKVRGVDFDVAYNPPPVAGLTLRGAVNWNRARYESFPNAPCGNGQTIAAGCDQNFNTVTNQFTAQDLSGRPLVRAPKWSTNFGFDYETPVGNGMTLSLGSSTAYTSKYSTNLIDREGFVQKGFFKTDANIALKGANDAWEVALIGLNLNNKITAGNCVNGGYAEGLVFGGQQFGMAEPGPAGEDESGCFVERGRSVWVRFTLRPFELQQ